MKTLKKIMMATAMTVVMAGTAHAEQTDGRYESNSAPGQTRYNEDTNQDSNDNQAHLPSQSTRGTAGNARESTARRQGVGNEEYRSTDAYNQFSTGYRGPHEKLDESYVREMQQALAERGFYDGQIDGLWGGQTTAAISEWQRSRGMAPTGSVNTESLQKLGVNVPDDTTGSDASETDMYGNH